jgi:hypothetical protein
MVLLDSLVSESGEKNRRLGIKAHLPDSEKINGIVLVGNTQKAGKKQVEGLI